MRQLTLILATALISGQSVLFAETLTIINTAQHAVVIGVYKHTDDGIRERLIPVKSMTEVRNVPISFRGNECFAVAYRAAVEDDEVKRATPATINGMRKLAAAKDKGETTPSKEHSEQRGCITVSRFFSAPRTRSVWSQSLYCSR